MFNLLGVSVAVTLQTLTLSSLVRTQYPLPRNIMWNVVSDNMILNASPTLDDAMVYAKGYNKFVTITDGTTEIVGKFGVDSVVDGKCPDGVQYDWNKASRIGNSRKKVT